MRGVENHIFHFRRLAMSGAALPAMAQDCKPLNVLIAADMRPERGVPTIPVTIGDAPKKLVVNTASVFSSLSQPAIKEMKLNTLQARVRLFDNAGDSSDRYVILPSLGIGSGKSDAVKFMVRPAPGPMNPNDASLVGVLGPDILQNYDVDMDFGGRKSCNSSRPIIARGKSSIGRRPRSPSFRCGWRRTARRSSS